MVAVQPSEKLDPLDHLGIVDRRESPDVAS
jgi:hypothetical protein